MHPVTYFLYDFICLFLARLGLCYCVAFSPVAVRGGYFLVAASGGYSLWKCVVFLLK